MNKKFNFNKYFFLFIIIFFMSCQDNIPNKNNKKEIPSKIFTKAIITYKDEGELKIKLHANIIKQFPKGKNQNSFFKKVYIIFYKKNNIILGKLKSNLIQEIIKDKIYKAIDQVEIINNQGNILRTNKIFWNKQQKKIYTNDLTKIYYSDGTKIIAKHGLESSEDLNNLILRNTKGVFLF